MRHSNLTQTYQTLPHINRTIVLIWGTLSRQHGQSVVTGYFDHMVDDSFSGNGIFQCDNTTCLLAEGCIK